MKAMPSRSMEAIADEFFSVNHGVTLEQIKAENLRGGRHDSRITWATAKLAIMLHSAGWGYVAIGRFLNRNHATIMYHCKDHNEKNRAAQS